MSSDEDNIIEIALDNYSEFMTDAAESDTTMGTVFYSNQAIGSLLQAILFQLIKVNRSLNK
jgi:HEPN domain-containing protein